MRARYYLLTLLSVLSLTTVNAQKVKIDGLNYYLFEDTHEAVIDVDNTWGGKLDIPSAVSCNGETYTVNGISWKAFYNCKKLTKVRIPKTIDHIVDHYLTDYVTSEAFPSFMNPFSGCSDLESIEVDEDNPVFKSVNGVLFSKDGTRFYGYPAGLRAESYSVPEGVTWIGSDAFGFNEYLVSVELPETVNTLFAAFRNCTKLEKVNLPAGLSYIHEGTFWECSNLKSIEIPSEVKEVGHQVFWNCSSLKTIDFPENITRIGGFVFYGCNLDALVIRGVLEKQSLDGFLFDELNKSAKIYVPSTELERYKSKFDRTFLPLEDYNTGVSPIPLPSTDISPVYSLSGTRYNGKPGKGVYIQNGRKMVAK